jgi:cytochrome P450
MTDSIDIDHHDREWIRQRHDRYAELRGKCPVVFNEHHDGFWMVTDYEPVAAVARDNETFAHRYEIGADDGIDYKGICGVPRSPTTPRMGVSEIDGPEHEPPHGDEGRRGESRADGACVVMVPR